MAEILSGSSTRGLNQNLISSTSQSVDIRSSYGRSFKIDRNMSTNNYLNSINSSKTILPIPSTGSQLSSSQTYYLMRAFLSGNIIYWSSAGGIDSTGANSGYSPLSLSFITFIGTKEL